MKKFLKQMFLLTLLMCLLAALSVTVSADVAAGAYYRNAVLWAVEKGVTNGMGNNQFQPDTTCTRGQIVTFLYWALGA